MTHDNIIPTTGDTVTLLDGDGNASENLTIVESVLVPYIEGIYEIEDRDGERYTIARYPDADTLTNNGWIEVWMDEE